MTRRTTGPSTLWHMVVRLALRSLVTPARRVEVMGDLVELWHLRRSNDRKDLWRATIRDLGGLVVSVRRRPAFSGGKGMWQDVTYAWRSWTRRPVAAAATVVTLALGIGAATAIMTAVYGLLLRPLPFPHPDQLVHVTNAPIRISRFPLVAPSFVDLAEIADAGTWQAGGVNVESGTGSIRAAAAVVDDGFFRVMGVVPVVGTWPPASDGRTRVAVVSWQFWRGSLGGDRSTVGRDLLINGRPFKVVGVMPPSFSFPDMTDLWVPPGLDFQVTGATYAPAVVARIADGVGLSQARSAVAAYTRARDGADRAASDADAMRIEPLGRELTRAVRPTLVFLLLSVGLLLLVVCASLANVLLARVAARSHEILVRRSLGAGRWRLARQVLVESVMLTAAGGAAGFGLAAGSLKTLRVLAPAGLRDAGVLSLDARLVLIMVLVSLVVAALMSVAPCLAIASREATVVRAGRGDSGARTWRGFRGGLIAAQMAMVLVLLTASAAAVGALLQVSQLHLGFGNSGTVGAAVTLPLARFPAEPAIVAYADDALARLRGAPGVRRAAATGVLPGHSETGIGLALSIPGASAAAPVYATYLAASPDYFQVMGIAVIAGRGISEADRPGAPVALVLSASTAGRLFPDGTAVGASVDLSFGRMPIRCEVVGVVADVRLTGLTANARSLQQMYVAFAQRPPFGTVSFVAEVDAGPAAGGRVLAETLASVDPSIPVYGVQALDDVVSRYLAAHRTAGVFVSAFAVVTLVVAAIGLYGLVAQVLAERLREMGIRLALGANPRRLRMQFVFRAVALAGCGAVGGALAAASGLTLMASVVPGLAEVPPVTFGVNVGVLVITAAAAAWWPSARITTIDPVAVMGDTGI